MARPRKEKLIPRPDDNLPPSELKKQWGKYLDGQMGRPTTRPHFEILMTPQQLEFYAEKMPQDWMKLEPSPKMQTFTEALQRSLPKLPLIQQLVVKKYYGIEKEPKTQQEIATELGLSSHKVVSRHLERAKKRLKLLIRRELHRLVREHLDSLKGN